jgi:hypothetical protein
MTHPGTYTPGLGPLEPGGDGCGRQLEALRGAGVANKLGPAEAPRLFQASAATPVPALVAVFE